MTARYVPVSSIRQGDRFAHHFDGSRRVCAATRDAELNIWPSCLVKVWGTYDVAGGRTLETWWGVQATTTVELLEPAQAELAEAS